MIRRGSGQATVRRRAAGNEVKDNVKECRIVRRAPDCWGKLALPRRHAHLRLAVLRWLCGLSPPISCLGVRFHV